MRGIVKVNMKTKKINKSVYTVLLSTMEMTLKCSKLKR